MTTDNRGRGVFASKDLKRGDLIIVEQSICEAEHDDKMVELDFTGMSYINGGEHSEVIKRLADIAKLKGIEALKMSYMFQGLEEQNH